MANLPAAPELIEGPVKNINGDKKGYIHLSILHFMSKISTFFGNYYGLCSRHPMSGFQATVFSFILTFLPFLLAKFVLVQTWKAYDDVALAMMSSGSGYSDVPDPHILFTNVLIGRVLTRLYTLSANLPWYSYYILLTTLLGLWAMNFSICFRRSWQSGVFLILVLFATYGLNILFAMTFTSAACTVGFGGFALLLSWWEGRLIDEKFSSLGLMVVGASLLILCSLVRDQSFMLVTILATLVFSIRICGDRKILKTKQLHSAVGEILGPFGLIVLTCLFAVGFRQTNLADYKSSPGWDEYYLANSEIANFCDFNFGASSTDKDRLAVERATGWTTNDLLMLQSRFCLDSERFSIRRMNIASQLLKGTHRLPISKAWQEMSQIFCSTSITGILTFLLYFSILHKNQSFSRWQILLVAGVIFALMFFLLIDYKLPDRVYIPLLVFPLYLLIFYANDKSQTFQNRIFNQAASALGLIFLLGATACSYLDNSARGQAALSRNISFKSSLKALAPTNQKLYIDWCGAFPYGAVLPYDDLHALLKDFRILAFGFRAKDALATKTMRRFDISLNGLGNALLRKNVYLMSNDPANKLLSVYLAEHYGLETEVAPQQIDGNRIFPIYQVCRLNGQIHRSKE